MAFPDDHDRELQRKAFDTFCLAEELMDWMGDHNPERRKNGIGVIRQEEEFQLLNLRRKAGSMVRSSKVPVAAAVYGPSQVGKSLFVGRVLEPQQADRSPLGRDENAGPPAYYPQLSFEFDLNPNCGANEATALVSRFTTKDRFDEDAAKMKNYAVLVRGLSRAEWLRVLARGFRSECDMPNKEFTWGETELEELFIKSAAKSPADAVDRHWRMDLLDVFTYLKRLEPLRYRPDESTFNGLLSRYAMGPAGYVEIAATLCWAGWPELTALFHRICDFLDKMRKEGRDGMLVHWAAVRFLLDSQQTPEHESPQSKHFPKVSANDIVDKFEDGWYVLDYQPGKGPPREQLTTIQCAMLEMVIPLLPERLKPQWREVLAHIDFLDIPGMKAGGRGETGGIHKDAKDFETQMSIVKRGKVFYLFERYIDELQAQTLLMLIRGGNLNVGGFLKGYLDQWGRARYGEENWPQRVPLQKPSLFLGLTGIDDEIEKGHVSSTLYEIRLKEIVHNAFKEVMTDFGGPGLPFTNIYPIRYSGTLDCDERKRNLLGPERWIAAGEAFLKSAMVQKYVAHREHKWSVAMKDGDGGTSLLAEAFRDVTSSVRKQKELEKGVADTLSQLLTLSRNWVVDGNTNLDRAKRVALANEVLSWLTAEPRLIYHRIRALEESLCFRSGDVLPIADFMEIATTDRDGPLSAEKRFSEALKSFLRDWATQWAPGRWHDYTSEHRNAGNWLHPDVFAALTRYFVDYLTSNAVFGRLSQRLLQLASLRINNYADRRISRRKFVRLTLNDYLMNPGDSLGPLDGGNPPAPPEPPPSSPEATGPDPDAKPSEPAPEPPDYGLMAVFMERWKTRLPSVLAAGAGNEVNVPIGNDDLIEILRKHKEILRMHEG